ncbi:DNA-methyltransferase [Calditrichota bacterium]
MSVNHLNYANRLYLGNNVQILHEHIPDQSVDMIYLDPPFLTGKSFNLLNGNQRPAYDDKWTWNTLASNQFQKLVSDTNAKISNCLESFRNLAGESAVLTYMTVLTECLVECKRVLRTTGSLYLHCDFRVSAYVRLMLDAIFGADNFLNQIAWCYGLGGSSQRYYPRKHDDILFYAVNAGEHFFNPPMVPASSQRMKGQLKKAPDYWQIPTVNNMALERNGYPTQKPKALLERIIAASSKEGDTVLDPYCGSGTTLVVAAEMERQWIGIDSSKVAIKIAEERLLDVIGEKVRQ